MDTKIGKVSQIKFKAYDQKQVMTIPIKIEELIPKEHLVRVVNEVVERIELEELESFYKGGGSSSYHPRMMLKVWLYGYCERVYTSRKLAKAMRENVNFIWLSGNQQPCFKTLSEFRGSKMEGMVDGAFKTLLKMLVELGYVRLEDLYVDGSKWEANGNRHKVVWRKNTKRYKEKVEERIEALLKEIKQLQKQEDEEYGAKDLLEVGQGQAIEIRLTSEEVKKHIVSLQSLVSQEAEKAKAKNMEQLTKKLQAENIKLEKYEEQEAILDKRNSYNKTDTDATMVRMKDERLLPGYNVQHTTNNQYIVNYTLAQNASDSPTLIPHLDKLEERLVGFEEEKPKSLTADAGYGSEENYAELDKRGITAFVKYPLWFQEISGELEKKKFQRENWKYDSVNKFYTCLNNRKLVYKENVVRISDNGYKRELEVFECESCEGCPFASECIKSQKENKNRTVMHSPKGEAYKAKAKELLDSAEGQERRSNRAIEVESVFGDMKYNMGHNRFLLRGINKVYIEYGLIAMAHNLRKVYCKQSGVWKDYYAQRASKKGEKIQKRA